MVKEKLQNIIEARNLLLPYGLLRDQDEARKVAELCLEANKEPSLLKELNILHILFRRPPNILV